MEPLKPVSKGQRPTVLDADVANEWIRHINYALKGRVVPESVGEYKNSPDGPILDLTRIESYINDLVETAVSNAITNLGDRIGISATCNEDGTLTVNLIRK